MALMLVSLLAMNPQLTNLEQDMLLAGMLVVQSDGRKAGFSGHIKGNNKKDQRRPHYSPANMDMHLDLSLLVDPLLVVPGTSYKIGRNATDYQTAATLAPAFFYVPLPGYAFVSPYGGTRIRTVGYQTDSSASGSVTTITPASGSNTDGGVYGETRPTCILTSSRPIEW